MIARSYRCRRLAGVWWALLLALVASASPAFPAPPEESVIADDGDLQELNTALGRSLVYLRTVPAATRYPVAGWSVPVQRLIDSLLHLQRFLPASPSPAALDREIRRAYEVIRINSEPDGTPKRMLITGYYQPVFTGRLDRQPPYIHPLHRVPPDLLVRQTNGRKQVLGRRAQGKIVPYWTRRQIEQGNLLPGQELVWLKDPFDAFVLHVQGSGIVHLADGSRRGVHYAINNGHPYRSIGKYLVDTGRMRLADVTMDSIRRYIEAHPEERESILHHNDSYIFFEWSRPGPAIGSLGQELTPGRSIAVDRQCYPPGGLVYVDSRRPIMVDGQVREWQPLRRLTTVQDSGSGLAGPGRIDIFWGTGDQAGMEAGQMKEGGAAYLLLLKEGGGD